jgi:hypothetical protein
VSPIPEDAFVFNVVVTPETWPVLRYFVASQIAHSGARFRLVANGCSADEVTLLRTFADVFPGRVVEVFEACERMQAHGVALERVLVERDDDGFFAMSDPDILAGGPFVADFAERLEYGAAGVTSGRGIWRDDSYVPEGHPGVSGEHFYAQDGFLFGSPHFAMYRREPVVATIARWDVHLGSAGGATIPEAALDALHAAGHDYLIYDTAKIVNVFLQLDGNRLEHFEHRNLVHIGGVSHYLTQPDVPGGGVNDPRWPWPVTRLEVSRYCAAVLQRVTAGAPAPAIPDDVEPAIAERLGRVRDALVDLVGTYRPVLDG